MTETLSRPAAEGVAAALSTSTATATGVLDALAVFEQLTYTYPGAEQAALSDIDLSLARGLTLVAGDSASGKSSLLRVLNGLVPHFHGGRIRGDALVLGDSVIATPTRRLARKVGFVFQDPETGFVCSTVEKEVAFGAENLGMSDVGRRVEEALDAVGIGQLRGRRLAELSGGERQRVALASVLATEPTMLALDEPTSQLDPGGADAFLTACLSLAVRGTSLVIAEHRLERVLPLAGEIVLMRTGTIGAFGPARDVLSRLPDPPPLVALGRRLGWDPLPLTIEAARVVAPRLARSRDASSDRRAPGEPRWTITSASVGPGAEPVLEGVDIAGYEGEVVVLMGDNGSGKTSLLRAIAGLLPPAGGTVARRAGRVAYLPQDPSALLHRPTVREEVEVTLRRTGSREKAEIVLREFGLLGVAGRYPRDLSGGERQRTAIAAIVAGDPEIVLLDEPTRGMDGTARTTLVKAIQQLRARGSSVVVATHDADLAAHIGDRIIRLENGAARDLGGADAALSGASAAATQIGRLYPGGPVTVEGVLARL
ncbi:MAG TPA: ATP-binding cassette domain-containing protein [Candidatus Solibacter sp.]|jgi:energy-coupling factor transporter ATP-binding protein EcfA2|nr:ATP-binding cassette domain-containing protein [Candidatus Solibacter sp.]